MLKVFSGRKALLRYFAFCFILSVVGTKYTHGQSYKGRVVIRAPEELVSFGTSVQTLIFDTIICDTCIESVPSWKRLGGLAVDSIYVPEGPHAVEQATQLEGLQINSVELLSVLTRARTWMLRKAFPDSQPEDTIRWSGILKKWVKVSDLSTFYEVRFDTSIALDSVFQWLEEVPNLLDFHSVPIPIMDSIDSPDILNKQ